MPDGMFIKKYKVGMYVRVNNDTRTICLGIGKIVKINDDSIFVESRKYFNELPVSYQKSQITKSSDNPIDLIEVGDYVNGKKVIAISDFKDGSRYIEFDEGRYLCKNYQIKSIVTKEQFDSVKYEVE